MSMIVKSVSLPETLIHGQKTVTTAGTEVALTTSKSLKSGVMIKALTSNTGIIYVGLNPVTSSTGFELLPGESVFLEIYNSSLIYIDSSVSSEGVSYIGS